MQTWQKLRDDPSLWKRFFLREKTLKAIREFFHKQNFHEVETPLLLSGVIPESYLDVFETKLKDRYGNEKKMFLAASPEASIKKLLAAGIGNCFEITKSFRNGETGSNMHNPEFTILEWYRVKATYEDIMRDCEKLLLHILGRIRNSRVSGILDAVDAHSSQTASGHISGIKNKELSIKYKNRIINFTPPWERISVSEALNIFAGISFDEITDRFKGNDKEIFSPDKIRPLAEKKGYKVENNNTWEEIFNQIFLNEIESHLGTRGKPTFIYDYPKPLAALAKTKKSDPRLVERFELYIGGLELADCYTELTDYPEQKERFDREMQKIKNKNKIIPIADTDFLEALKSGLPDCAGIAFGVDRLVMLFTDCDNIKHTMLFPLDDS